MDKWTRTFLDSGFSAHFQEVMKIIDKPKQLRKWAEARTDGAFGPLFGLTNVPEWLSFAPQLLSGLSRQELDQYRQICAVSSMTQETRIPPFYLLFRDWGFASMKSYMDEWIKPDSRWSPFVDEWASAMTIIHKIDLSQLSALDERSKLLLYVTAKNGGYIAAEDIPKSTPAGLRFFSTPELHECVRYKLNDMKTADLAAFLKTTGLKQVGNKLERIERIFSALSVDEIANRLKVNRNSYLQLNYPGTERDAFCYIITFLHDISAAAYRLDFSYINNLHQIKDAQQNGYGIHLSHNGKCPVHKKSVYRHNELNSIHPIAHPDCDAAILCE